MDETIGAKGGKNDRKRSLMISKRIKKKLQEQEEKEISELEQKVKKQQKYTLIRTIPIILFGGTVQTLYDVSRNKGIDTKEEEGSKWRIKEYDADVSSKTPLEEKIEKAKKSQEKENQKKKVVVVLEDGTEVTVSLPVIKEEQKQSQIEDSSKKKKEQTSSMIDSHEHVFFDDQASEINEEQLSDGVRNRLQKLKARKIIETYEEELKDIRYELRQLTSDYQVLAKQEEEIIYSHEATEILEKLSNVIDRIERLKRKIKIEDLDQYDDNYIYTLIEDYLFEFRNGHVIDEVKDSPLYVLIAEKLNELETEKDTLDKRVRNKKELLEEREERFEKLREQFFSIEKMNQELLDFQNEQDYLLREVQEKIKNAVSVEERVKVEVEALNLQSRRLLRLLAFQMLFPGSRGAKRFAATTAAYLYFARQIIHPKTTTRKYKVITVKDYSEEIANSMHSLDDASLLLEKTNQQIDKMITEIKETFQDYIGVVPECDSLLSHLQEVKRDLEEKEYEMDKIKNQQIQLMEKNNAKVKKRGEYPM